VVEELAEEHGDTDGDARTQALAPLHTGEDGAEV
jgi:hypothetical protein